MTKLRTALLSACAVLLPLAGAAAAGPTNTGVVVYDFFGRPIGMLTPLPAGQPARADAIGPTYGPAVGAQMIREVQARMMPEATDIDAMFAQQDTLMRSIMARMEALASAPAETIATPGQSGATRIVISTYESGRGSCTQTISYGPGTSGNELRPVSHTVGDGCSGIAGNAGVRTVPASEPSAEPPDTSAPEPATGAPKVYHIKAHLPSWATPRAYSG